MAGGVTESIQGGSFGHGAWLGAATAAIGFATPATGNVFADFTIRAALGGATSVLGSGKFINGALTAAFAYVASNVAESLSSGEYLRQAYDRAHANNVN